MGGFSVWHWLVVLAIVVIVFGAGRLPSVMGDLAKGIKNFKSGMREGEADDRPQVLHEGATPVPPQPSATRTGSTADL